MRIPITEYDVVFISYDEPNADDNYADLLNKIHGQNDHMVCGAVMPHIKRPRPWPKLIDLLVLMLIT